MTLGPWLVQVHTYPVGGYMELLVRLSSCAWPYSYLVQCSGSARGLESLVIIKDVKRLLLEKLRPSGFVAFAEFQARKLRPGENSTAVCA